MNYNNESNEFRILVVGKTGSGVSSTANSILSEHFFDAHHSALSITCKSQRRESFIHGRKIVIAETPGFKHNIINYESIQSEIRRGIQLLHPGPHIILYTISKSTRYSDDDASMFQKVFGKGVYPYVMVVFTGDDDQDWETLEQYSRNMTMTSKEFFSKFGQRSIHINNKSKLPEKQMRIKHFFELISNVVTENNHSYFKEDIMPKSMSHVRDGKKCKKHLIKLILTLLVGGTLFYFIKFYRGAEI